MAKQEVRYLDDKTCKEASLSSMMNVVKLENGEERFVCRECNKSYSHHTSLYRHFKNAHTEKCNKTVALRKKIREDQRLAKTYGLPYYRKKNEKRRERSTTKKNKNKNKENAPPTSIAMEPSTSKANAQAQAITTPTTIQQEIATNFESDIGFFDALIEEALNKNHTPVETQSQTSMQTCMNSFNDASTSQEYESRDKVENQKMDDHSTQYDGVQNILDTFSHENIDYAGLSYEIEGLPTSLDHLFDSDVSKNEPMENISPVEPKSKENSPPVENNILGEIFQCTVNEVPESSSINEGCSKSSSAPIPVLLNSSVENNTASSSKVPVFSTSIPKKTTTTIVKNTNLKRALNTPKSQQPPIKILRKDISGHLIQNNTGSAILQECRKCFRNYLSKEDLNRHLKSCTGPRTIKLTNGLSNVFKKQKVEIALDKPVTTSVPGYGTPSSNPIVLNNVTMICNICGLGFKDLIGIANHGCQRT